MSENAETKKLRKFSVVIDDEVAFTWAPNPDWVDSQDAYELVVAALASSPQIIEIPIDNEYYMQVRGGWKYKNGVLTPPSGHSIEN